MMSAAGKDKMAPTYANGKICYVQIPATDIARSVDFYRGIFGWDVRTRDDGSVSFDDTVGQVSGSWVLGRPPAAVASLMIHIMVDDMQATVDAIVAEGMEIVRPIGADAPEITAWFRDPAGNVIGLYQHRG